LFLGLLTALGAVNNLDSQWIEQLFKYNGNYRAITSANVTIFDGSLDPVSKNLSMDVVHKHTSTPLDVSAALCVNLSRARKTADFIRWAATFETATQKVPDDFEFSGWLQAKKEGLQIFQEQTPRMLYMKVVTLNQLQSR